MPLVRVDGGGLCQCAEKQKCRERDTNLVVVVVVLVLTVLPLSLICGVSLALAYKYDAWLRTRRVPWDPGPGTAIGEPVLSGCELEV